MNSNYGNFMINDIERLTCMARLIQRRSRENYFRFMRVQTKTLGLVRVDS